MTLPQTIDKVIQLQKERMEMFQEDEHKALTALAYARGQQRQCHERIRELQQSKESMERIMKK